MHMAFSHPKNIVGNLTFLKEMCFFSTLIILAVSRISELLI